MNCITPEMKFLSLKNLSRNDQVIRIRIYTNADCLWSKRVLFRLSSKDSWRGRENDILLEICSNDADVAVKVRKKTFFKD